MLAAIQDERARLDQDVWVEEVAAQAYEGFFVSLWDQMRAAEAPLDVLMNASFDELSFPTPIGNQTMELGIRSFLFGDQERTVNSQGWQQIGKQLRQQGFQLLESEWHHASFERSPEGVRSQVSFVLHLARPLAEALDDDAPQQRIVVRGNLDVNWNTDQQPPTPADVTASKLEILTRTGLPGFRRVLSYRRRPEQYASARSDPRLRSGRKRIPRDIDQPLEPSLLESR